MGSSQVNYHPLKLDGITWYNGKADIPSIIYSCFTGLRDDANRHAVAKQAIPGVPPVVQRGRRTGLQGPCFADTESFLQNIFSCLQISVNYVTALRADKNAIVQGKGVMFMTASTASLAGRKPLVNFDK